MCMGSIRVGSHDIFSALKFKHGNIADNLRLSAWIFDTDFIYLALDDALV